MPTVATPETVADLIASLGGVPMNRVRLVPTPGTATEADLLALLERADKVLCELVDGTLVEKPVGQEESALGMMLGHILLQFIAEKGIKGRVTGSDGGHRLRRRRVRLPDVSFTHNENLPTGGKRRAPIASWVPDLAIEVLSRSNRKGEMERKLHEYFDAGVSLVWYIDPRTRTIRVFEDAESHVELGDDDALDGGSVLPGFSLSVAKLFDSVLDEEA